MRSALLVIALALGVGCSDVSLVGISQETVVERFTLSGEVCAPPHLTLDVPYRVLFVIDTSLSNEWNDPTQRRVDAVKQAINANIAKPNVSFGVITFSDAPRVQTLAFTRDPLVLSGAIGHIEIPQGATNYADTLWTVKSFLLDDLNSLPMLEAARTHYLVFWLSDGMPTVGSTEPLSIVPMVTTLRDLIKPRVAEFRIDTAFLGARTSSAAEAAEALAARGLLEQMAAAASGRFNNIPEGQAFTFDIDLTPILAVFQLETVLVSNRNLVLGEKGPEADSDGDGLSDALEVEAGLDPTSEDTDRDGYRDGVEWNSNGKLNPLEPEATCPATTDTDGDGLRDCEELAIGTKVETADSDGDGLPDGLELLAGTSPLDARALLDQDGDGVADQVEVRGHLPPGRFNKAKDITNWSYRYQLRTSPGATATEAACTEVVVENLAMVPTKASAPHVVGVNTFEFYALFALEGGLEPRWSKARFEGRVLSNPYAIIPATNTFKVGATQFTPFP